MTSSAKTLTDLVVETPFIRLNIPHIYIGDMGNIPKSLRKSFSFANEPLTLVSINVYNQDCKFNPVFVEINLVRDTRKYRDIEFRFSISNVNLTITDLLEGINKNICKDDCDIHHSDSGLSAFISANSEFHLWFDGSNHDVSLNNKYYSNLLRRKFQNLSKQKMEFYSQLTEEKYHQLIKPSITVQKHNNKTFLIFGEVPHESCTKYNPTWRDSSGNIMFLDFYAGLVDILYMIETKYHDAFAAYLSDIFIKDNEWAIKFDKTLQKRILDIAQDFNIMLKQNDNIMS